MTGGSQARVLACDPIVILACDLIVNLDWGTFAIWIMSHPRRIARFPGKANRFFKAVEA